MAKDVTVPDIGDFDAVPIIEIHVAVGDTVSAEDPLITLESDKAAMDVPAPFGGTVTEIKVAVGDEVGEGAVIMLFDAADEGGSDEPEKPAESESKPKQESAPAPKQESKPQSDAKPRGEGGAQPSPAMRASIFPTGSIRWRARPIFPTFRMPTRRPPSAAPRVSWRSI